jgi:hypothetical protein
MDLTCVCMHGPSRLGDSALILDFTELLDTTAAGPIHVLSALKVATNENYCLGSYTLQVIYMYPSKAYLTLQGIRLQTVVQVDSKEVSVSLAYAYTLSTHSTHASA